MFEIAGGIIIAVLLLHLWPLIALALIVVLPFVVLAGVVEEIRTDPVHAFIGFFYLGLLALFVHFCSKHRDKPEAKVIKEPEPQRPIPEVKKRVNLLGRRQRLNPKVNQLLIMRRIAKKKKTSFRSCGSVVPFPDLCA